MTEPCTSLCRECPHCDCTCARQCDVDCHQISEGNRQARGERTA